MYTSLPLPRTAHHLGIHEDANTVDDRDYLLYEGEAVEWLMMLQLLHSTPIIDTHSLAVHPVSNLNCMFPYVIICIC